MTMMHKKPKAMAMGGSIPTVVPADMPQELAAGGRVARQARVTAAVPAGKPSGRIQMTKSTGFAPKRKPTPPESDMSAMNKGGRAKKC